jgi:hypothetical protein
MGPLVIKVPRKLEISAEETRRVKIKMSTKSDSTLTLHGHTNTYVYDVAIQFHETKLL